MTSNLDRINQGLAVLTRIRKGHHENAKGFCAECHQQYPCVTINSLNEGMDEMMAPDSKGAKQTESMKKKKARNGKQQ